MVLPNSEGKNGATKNNQHQQADTPFQQLITNIELQYIVEYKWYGQQQDAEQKFAK
jgi:HKD family nuclease